MIKKLDIIKDTRNVIDKGRIIHTVANFTAIEKINELVDVVNELQARSKNVQPDAETRSKNVQPDYATITYTSDGHIKKFYGHDSIVELEVPLPQGTKITIRSITKGDGNE